jgi:hypothetical protein
MTESATSRFTMTPWRVTPPLSRRRTGRPCACSACSGETRRSAISGRSANASAIHRPKEHAHADRARLEPHADVDRQNVADHARQQELDADA